MATAGDISIARRAAKDMALSLGFDARASEDIAPAVSELASNLVRHAQGGQLRLTPVTEGGRVRLHIEALDRGPGIADVEHAMWATRAPRGACSTAKD